MSPRNACHRVVCIGLAVLSCMFAGVAAVDAQAPVITNPGDLRMLSVNTVFRPLDPNPGWTPMAPMPTARAGFATAAAGGKIYTMGGATVHDCLTVSTVEAYNPEEDLWTTGLAKMPAPLRWRPSSSALDDIVYVVGGASREEGCNGETLATVQAYDPATDRWSDKPFLPDGPRAQVGVGVDSANHLLYAVGGATAGPAYIALDTVEVYDPAGNGGAGSWTTKQHLNTPRGFPAIAAVNGKIYAVGGQKENFGVIDTVEEFDPDANGGFGAWTTKPSVMPHPRSNSAAAVLDGKIYIIGGEGGGLRSGVDVYDPSLDVWITGVPMLTARRTLGAAVGAAATGDGIFAIGGEGLVATVDQQFIYQITATNNPSNYDVLPPPEGLSIDHMRGIIFGTPTTSDESFDATFTATNGSGSDSRDVSFYIAPATPPDLASFASSTCVTGRAGQPFRFQVLTNNAGPEAQLMATGLPYKAGAGPEMTIDPGTGLISGTVPSKLDGSAQSFGVGLALADGSSAQSFLQLTFVSDPLLPVITSSSNAALVLNQFFSYTITTDAPVTFFDYLGLDGNLDGTLPAGLSFDRVTGTISGRYSGEMPTGCPTGIDTIKKEPPPRIQLLTFQDGSGTGTAPLNFFIGLHDFEVETLRTGTSERTNYVIFTDDPLTSGSGAGLIEATNAGDYVSYKIPVPRIGTYDVRVGIRTGENQGTFQLSIDGADQGSPEDEYSREIGYEVRDLGPVTFANPGNHTFRFTTAGRNPVSSGYELVFDYLDLVPHFEAEKLAVQAHSAPYQTIHDPTLSGHAGTLFKPNRRGDYVTYTVPVAKAGIYDVRVKAKGKSNAGIFRLRIDGIRRGYAQMGGDPGHGVWDLGTMKFETAGNKAFEFLLSDRRNVDCDLVLDYIELVLARRLEAENLAVDGSTRLRRVGDARMSGQTGMLFNPEVPGDAVNYKIAIPVAGTYRVKLGMRADDKSGIVQLAIDGVSRGSAQDGYSPEDHYEVVDLGKVVFTEAGEKTFQFAVTGQNSNSRGYRFVLDYIDLVR
jgi:N-acetylneuraminic acid mutarotase